MSGDYILIVRIVLAAGLFFTALPAVAADVASTHVAVGTPSGKLAHVAYRPISRADCAARVMHTVPAGKINHWAAMQNARCPAREARATTATATATARD